MASEVLEIRCSGCGARIARYRKQGTGALLKLYLDRVIEPDELARRGPASSLPPLDCPQCHQRLDLAMAGERGRPAYRLIQGTFRRRKAG